MTKSATDLSFIEVIPIVHDFLTDDCPLNSNQIRRYLLDLTVMYPYITNKYRTFDVFLSQVPNKKATFFNKFIEDEFAVRMKRKPNRDKVNCRNRLIRIVWGVQGFLGKLSGVTGDNYKANHDFIESQIANPDVTSPIDTSDLLYFFDEVPGEGRRRLKFLFWTTWNTIDAVQLCMNDFKSIESEYGPFYYVKKWRRKTMRSKIIYLGVFEPQFYDEFDRYCTHNDIKGNDPIFSRLIEDPENPYRVSLKPCSMRAYFKYWTKKTGANEFIMPKTIRALGITELRNVFKDDTELLQIWSQHHTDIITQHYTKDLLNRYIERMPKIRKTVGIENVRYLTAEVKQLKDDIQFKLDIHDQEIEQLKQKKSPAAQKSAEEFADEILNLVEKKVKQR